MSNFADSPLYGPLSSTDTTLTPYYYHVRLNPDDKYTRQVFTQVNTFNNYLSLSSLGLSDENYPIYTSEIIKAGDTTFLDLTNTDDGTIYRACPPYTSKVKRTTGATFLVQNNRTYGEEEILSGMGVSGDIYGDYVYNAVWNDLADCIEVPDNLDLEDGKCYAFDGETYKLSSKYLEDGILGIHSDTAGFYIGNKEGKKCLYIAIAGFVLAYVDKDYKPGTPLTCGENGNLTELKEDDLIGNAHKVIATYWKPEHSEYYNTIKVNNRKWVKVR